MLALKYMYGHLGQAKVVEHKLWVVSVMNLSL